MISGAIEARKVQRIYSTTYIYVAINVKRVRRNPSFDYFYLVLK